MQFKIKSDDIAKVKTPCLIVGVFDKRKLSGPGEALDKASGGALTALLGKGDMQGRKGTTLMVYDPTGIKAERVLLVGCGKRKEFDRKAYGKALGAALARLGEAGVTEALWTLAELPKGLSLYAAVRLAAEQAAGSTYRYEHTKAAPKDAPARLKSLGFSVSTKHDAAIAERASAHGKAIAAGVGLAVAGDGPDDLLAAPEELRLLHATVDGDPGGDRHAERDLHRGLGEVLVLATQQVERAHAEYEERTRLPRGGHRVAQALH